MLGFAERLAWAALLIWPWAGAALGGTPSPHAPLPAITVTGTFLAFPASVAFIIGPDRVTERTYREGECLPRAGERPEHTCTARQVRLAAIERDGIVVEQGGRRVRVAVGKGPSAGPGERYLTREDVVENVCGNFAGTACEEIGMIEAGKAKPVQFIIYPMCFEVFVQDWRHEGAACLAQAMYILNYVAYVEFY